MAIAAIEAGEIKFRAAVLNANLEIQDELQVPTTTPEKTVGRIIEFLRPTAPASIEIASFGLLNLDENSATFGTVRSGLAL